MAQSDSAFYPSPAADDHGVDNVDGDDDHDDNDARFRWIDQLRKDQPYSLLKATQPQRSQPILETLTSAQGAENKYGKTA